MDTAMNDLHRRMSMALGLGLVVMAASCVSVPYADQDWRVPPESDAQQTFDQWFRGEIDASDVEAERQTAEVPDAEIEGDAEAASMVTGFDVSRRFTIAEMAFWKGDVERAFELYADILREEPAHPLTRFVATRLYELRQDVVDWKERIRPLLKQTTFDSVHPLGRVYLSLAGQTIHYSDWLEDHPAEPFAGDDVGFPAEWTISPRMSPFHRLGFDRGFSIDDQPTLASEYIAPWFAEDRPVNRRPSKPYLPNSLELSPNLSGEGLYYLETFMTVSSPEGGRRDFWVYGNFPAATEVRIDGNTVFRRQMGSYGTGKRMRRVKLSPGVHRVRVKLAYDQNYRDSFDIAFLADDATPVSDSGVTFSRTAPSGFSAPGAGVRLRGDSMTPYELEPLMVPESGLQEADSSAVYLTALAAYFDHQPQYFEPAMQTLLERHGDFAPAWGLKSLEVATRWEIPSDKRSAQSLSHLRKAHALDGDSIRFTSRLASRLRQRSPESREVRELLEAAREMARGSDGDLKALEPFNAWADWLESRGWAPMAENGWRRALEVEPTNCTAANSLQDLLYQRGVYPELSSITEAWEKCPGLERRQLRQAPDAPDDERLALTRRMAERHPYDAGRQIALADALRRRGETDRAHRVLRDARTRMPWSSALVSERANRIFADSGQQAAVDFMRESFKRNGGPGVWELRRLSTLTNEVPLSDLLVDGREVAMEHLSGEQSSVGQSDEAYYVVDYAASDYSENGVRRTLTHTLVRVMTKGAIDRFAETQVPGGAELIRIRTIKEDGTTLVPERTSGKSTLSMPGLDEGDFVEVAYLTHRSESQPVRSTRRGMRFFFQMSDISSLRSQYTVLGADEAKFTRQNGAPEAETVETEAGSGETFVRRDSPRPRREPHRVRGTEYLPWIQMYREGTTVDFQQVHRMSARNQVLKGLEVSDAFRRQVDEWREGTEPGTVAEMRDLFYDVTGWFNDPSPQSLTTDVSHALYTRSGSPVMMLHAAYQLAGIPSQIHMVKSANQDPATYPMGEFAKYRYAVLRVQKPDGSWTWVQPGHEDAMFGLLGLLLHGQPAICVSCEDPSEGAQRVPGDGFPTSRREIHVESSLSADGTLTGTAKVTFNGIRAMTVRKTLTQVPEKAKRQKFMGRIMTGLIPGSSLEAYRIRHEDDHDKPLTFELDFTRRQFARTSNGSLSVQTTLFRVPMASLYAKLQSRQTPMMIRGQRRADFQMTIRLPLGYSAEITSRTGAWEFESAFGSFSRKVEAGGEAVTVRSSVHLPIQRIGTDAYGDFREFAVSVERSSRFLMDLRQE